MPRYVVERSFPDGLAIPITQAGADAVASVVANNLHEGVTWVHSYVSEDRKTTYCVYDAPSPQAIQKAANKNNLPVHKITLVRVLDPYFYMNH